MAIEAANIVSELCMIGRLKRELMCVLRVCRPNYEYNVFRILEEYNGSVAKPR